MIFLPLFLLIPFVQLGISYYASVATVITLTMIWYWRHELVTGLIQDFWFRPFVFVVMLMVPIITSPHAAETQDVLRSGREALFFLVMTTLFGRMVMEIETRQMERYLNVVLLVTMGLAALAVVQAYYFSRSVYFGIPEDLFVANSNTLPGQLDLIYSKIRPMGTFGEPSYLGFVLFSFVYAFSPMMESNRKVWVLIGLVLFVMVLSQSLSFFLSMSSFLLYIALAKRYVSPAQLALFGTIGAAGLLASGVIDHFVERLASMADMTEEFSGFVRIVGPALLLPEYLEKYPFGNTFGHMVYALAPMVKLPVDWMEFLNNSIWNFFFFNGFFAIVLFIVLFLSIREMPTRLYIFMVMFCNGGFLSIDKCGLLILFVGLFRSITYSVARRTDEMEGEGFEYEGGLQTISGNRIVSP